MMISPASRPRPRALHVAPPPLNSLRCGRVNTPNFIAVASLCAARPARRWGNKRYCRKEALSSGRQFQKTGGENMPTFWPMREGDNRCPQCGSELFITQALWTGESPILMLRCFECGKEYLISSEIARTMKLNLRELPRPQF